MGVCSEVSTRFIVDYEIHWKLCYQCSQQEKQLAKKKITLEKYQEFQASHKCNKNYEGRSAGMEKNVPYGCFSDLQHLDSYMNILRGMGIHQLPVLLWN